jgi:hypothetical protein
MRTLWRRVGFTTGLLVVLLGVMLLGSIAPAKASYFTNLVTQLTSSPGDKGEVNTDGKTVVWTGRDGSNGQTLQIFYARLADRQVHLLSENGKWQSGAMVEGDDVIWNRLGPDTAAKVYYKNLSTGQEQIIGEGINPKLSGDWAVWDNGLKGYVARNIRTLDPEIRIGASSLDQFYVFEDSRVIYAVRGMAGLLPRGWTLYSIKIGDSQPTVLESGNTNNDLGGFDLKNGLLVYSVGNDLKTINFKTEEHKTLLSTAPYAPAGLTTDGRYIFWMSQQPGIPYTDGILPGYQEYDLATGVLLSFDTVLRNDVNRFIQAREGNLIIIAFNQLYFAPVSAFLPTIPQPPIDINNSQNYFYETGHTLANGFKNFWDKNGGLAVFGYSQTEEFGELNPDTGKIYTVQYFERQRYEYHPENAGTPYEVLLGRLGVTDARKRNLLNTPAFQPATNSGAANCFYYPETQHQTCGDFLDYWRSHGLDLGEAGNSYRESLALFGFPISEAYTDPQTGFLTQYFERARFEYHPENKGTPYAVLLGLVGDRELQDRGWVPGA